jgi:ParB family transcriptional regulator, chromosome partitioning protein
VPQRPAPRWISLADVVETEEFRFRSPEAVASLAESIVRHGQREPVDLRPVEGGYQLLGGHRRLEAVRMLRRDRILGHVHDGLGDDDALLLALADDLDRRAFSAAERQAIRSRLESGGAIPPKVAALLDRADAQAPPEAEGPGADVDGDEEVDLDVLALTVRDRLADACNDLALLHEMWADLDEGRREDLVACVAYLKDMYPFLSAASEEES